jgi:hypothetical protein
MVPAWERNKPHIIAIQSYNVNDMIVYARTSGQVQGGIICKLAHHHFIRSSRWTQVHYCNVIFQYYQSAIID